VAIRIEGPGRPTGVAGNTPSRRVEGSGTNFQLPADSTPARGAAIGGGFGVQDLASLIALQAIPQEDRRERRRRATKHGFDLLDVLDGVKLDLLAGGVPVDRLERLVHLLGQRRDSDDPTLDALIEEIELRARVELAKFGRYPD
jgi:hypothetical protein